MKIDFHLKGVGGGTVYASQFLGLSEPTTISSYKQATEGLCNMKLKEVKKLLNFMKSTCGLGWFITCLTGALQKLWKFFQ